MDLQSFIQSGLLEAYVLGQCSAEERAEVERMAAGHAEVRAELSSIEASLEGYAAAHAVLPPDWMKASIMARIDKEAPDPSIPDAPNAQSRKLPLRLFQFLAFILAAICSFLLLRQKDMGRQHDNYRSTIDSLQQQLLACNQQVNTPDPIAELLCDPATQRFIVSDGKDINSVVYYNARLKKMAYDPYGLPAPKPGKYYQFWAIVGDKPVSMGMKPASICESIHTVEAPVAFAISEEDKPEGNPAPTKVLAVVSTG